MDFSGLFGQNADLLNQAASLRLEASDIRKTLTQEGIKRQLAATPTRMPDLKKSFDDIFGVNRGKKTDEELLAELFWNYSKSLDDQADMLTAANEAQVQYEKYVKAQKQFEALQQQGMAITHSADYKLARTIPLGGGQRAQIYSAKDGSLATVYQEYTTSVDDRADSTHYLVNAKTLRIGGFASSTTVDQASKFIQDSYDASNTWQHYLGYKATWVPLWRTAMKVADGDYVGAAFSFVDDVDTVLLGITCAKTGLKALIRLGKNGGLPPAVRRQLPFPFSDN